ncbi:TPA: hypothetical protein HA274_06595 [Candidatus Bathyarchaeota archaeon]|nr:hypothetical protein [Candidatus Bathyarchaeota archaeon]
MAPTTLPVVNIINKPASGPTIGTNISIQIMKLLPKIYCVSTPWSFSTATVWLSSLLIRSASSSSIGNILPIAVTARATIKTATIEKILLRRGEASVQIGTFITLNSFIT